MKDIQKIFVDHVPGYIEKHGSGMSYEQYNVLNAICNCQTGKAGQHLFFCPDCGNEHLADSSCGNRHCPVCQNGKAAEWVYRQQLKQLPCTYFLATFTLPAQLRSMALWKQQEVYQALFDASSQSLKALQSDKRFIGCDLTGFFGVLHTWGRQMQFHPHVHYVVPGGGLSADRKEWIGTTGDFLVHVRALSALFKAKFRAELARHGLAEAIAADVWKKDWVVHCKSVGDGEKVLTYLGAYVFRVAISNARIVDYDGKQVTFKYYKVGSNRPRHCTLTAFEFIRRYLQHVLPKGFVKVRHYGFLHSKCSVAIEQIRDMIYEIYSTVCYLLDPDPPEKLQPLICAKCSAPMKWRKFYRHKSMRTLEVFG